MSNKTKKNIIYFGVGLILIFVIRYFNLNFLPAMVLALAVSAAAGYLLKQK
ncbi:MAG: hypothetical protein ACLFSO_06585 [Halanaerobium sp.]